MDGRGGSVKRKEREQKPRLTTAEETWRRRAKRRRRTLKPRMVVAARCKQKNLTDAEGMNVSGRRAPEAKGGARDSIQCEREIHGGGADLAPAGRLLAFIPTDGLSSG